MSSCVLFIIFEYNILYKHFLEVVNIGVEYGNQKCRHSNNQDDDDRQNYSNNIIITSGKNHFHEMNGDVGMAGWK